MTASSAVRSFRVWVVVVSVFILLPATSISLVIFILTNEPFLTLPQGCLATFDPSDLPPSAGLLLSAVLPPSAGGLAPPSGLLSQPTRATQTATARRNSRIHILLS